MDLGGTNFRVLLITVKDRGVADMQSKIFAISNELMTGPGTKVLGQSCAVMTSCIASMHFVHE